MRTALRDVGEVAATPTTDPAMRRHATVEIMKTYHGRSVGDSKMIRSNLSGSIRNYWNLHEKLHSSLTWMTEHRPLRRVLIFFPNSLFFSKRVTGRPRRPAKSGNKNRDLHTARLYHDLDDLHDHIILYYIILYQIILYYIILNYIILYYIKIYYIKLYYIILYYIKLYYIILYYIKLYYIILY